MTPGVTPNIGAFENDSSDPGVTEASGSERPSSVGSALESTWLEAGFEILDLIGHGGMGVVFKARQLSLDRIVALKVLIAGQHASPTQRARFHLEAESIAQLQHPNVIQIYESGTNKSELFFSMEYCSGGSLADFIHEEKISASEAARIVLLLAEAVQTAHARGIIHRDIKPSNVLLLDDNERPISQRKPKLTDFGIAKNLQTQSGITQSGDVIGTPAYMAPEQAMGRVHSIGPATDIYAIGAILYQLLTGTPPFEAASSMETLSRVMRDDPVLPSRLTGHAIPKDLEVICLKCLEKNPEQRYVSAEALAEDLRCYLDHRPIQARPVSTFTRLAKWVKRHPVKTVVALGSLITTVLILGLLIGFFYQSKLKTSNEQLASTLNKW